VIGDMAGASLVSNDCAEQSTQAGMIAVSNTPRWVACHAPIQVPAPPTRIGIGPGKATNASEVIATQTIRPRPAANAATVKGNAAVAILRERLPELKIRVVNVVDLMRVQPDTEHPHGLSDMDLDELFTKDKPVIFAFQGYPSLIHRLTYRRTNHDNIHVRCYKEEGNITPPFDMTVPNDLDRFHLAMDTNRPPAADRWQRPVPRAATRGQAGGTQAVHHPARRRHARDPQLEVG